MTDMSTTYCTNITSRATGKATRTHHLTATFSDGQTAEIRTTKSYAYLVVDARVSEHDGIARAGVVTGTGDYRKAEAKVRSAKNRGIFTHRVLVMDDSGTYAPHQTVAS